MKFNSKSRTKKILAATWIIPVVLASPYTFTKPNPFVITSDLGSIARQTCTDRFDEIDALMYGPEVTGRFRRGFFTFLFLAIYLIPMIVILTTCVRIAICLLQPIAVRRWPPATRKDTGRRHEENKRRVARMVIVIAVAFIVSWSPFYLSTLVSQIQSISNDGHNFLRERNFLFTMLMIDLCGFLNSTINPLIYTGMSNKFRRSFKMILSGCICCRLTNRLLRYRDSLTRGMSAAFTSSLRQSMTEVRDANDLAPSDAGSSSGGGGGGGGGGGTADGPIYSGGRGSNLNHGSLRIHGGGGGGGSNSNAMSSQPNQTQPRRQHSQNLHINQSPSAKGQQPQAHDSPSSSSPSPTILRASPEVTKKTKSRGFRLFKSREQGEVLIQLAPLRKSSSKKKKQQQQQQKKNLLCEDEDSGSVAPPPQPQPPLPPSALKKTTANFHHQPNHLLEASVCDDEKQRFIGEVEEAREEEEERGKDAEKEKRRSKILGGDGRGEKLRGDDIVEEDSHSSTQDAGDTCTARTKLLPVSSTLHDQAGMTAPVLLHTYSPATNNLTLDRGGGWGFEDVGGAGAVQGGSVALNVGRNNPGRVPAAATAAVKTCLKVGGTDEVSASTGPYHVDPNVALKGASAQNGVATANENNNQNDGNFCRNSVFGDEVFSVDSKWYDSRPVTAGGNGGGPQLALMLASSTEGANTTATTTPVTSSISPGGSNDLYGHEPKVALMVAASTTAAAPVAVTTAAAAVAAAFTEPNGNSGGYFFRNAAIAGESDGLLPADRMWYDNQHHSADVKAAGKIQERPASMLVKGNGGVGGERAGGEGEFGNGVFSTMMNGGSRHSLKDYKSTGSAAAATSPSPTTTTTTSTTKIKTPDFQALDKAVDVLLKDSGREHAKPAVRLGAGGQGALKNRDNGLTTNLTTSPGTIVLPAAVAGQGGQCVQL